MYRIGIDLGGTNIAAGIVNEAYEIICQESVPTGADRSSEAIADDMAALCRSVCANISLISVCFITQQSFLRRRVSSGRSAVPPSFCTGICAIIPQLNGLCQGCH